MINNVTIMGRMVATPELRQTTTGKDVTSFTLAVDRNTKEKQADFLNCVAWGYTAEFISKYFQKGSMIAVTGSIQTRNYEDKNGNKRTATEILVNQASFCGGKTESKADDSADVPAYDTDDIEEIGVDLPF